MEMIGKVRRMKLREQLSNSEIAKRTGLSRNTVKKWLKAPGDQAPKYKRQSGFTKLSAFEVTLVQALKADSHRPKHARRSARALLTQLQAQGYRGGYSRLTDFIRAWREQEGKAASKAYVPLSFELGEAFQFDWSEEGLLIGGVYHHMQVSHLKLGASRAFWVVAYPSQGHEMLFDAHTRSFAALGGVARRGIYDNMKTAVDKIGKGKQRSVNARFEAMTGHYLFDPEFCNRAAGWEKGIVEKNVQDRRRGVVREITERRWSSLAELNEWLQRACQDAWQELAHPEWPELSIADVWQDEASRLMPCPKPFDGYVEQPIRVTSTSLIQYQRNRYSVPCEWVHGVVSLRVYPEYLLVVGLDGHSVRLERHFGRDQTIYDWQHYIALVERKPGALRNGAPFREMPEPLLELQRQLLKHPGGDRVMAQVLLAVNLHGLEEVLVATELALQAGRVSAEHVLNVIARLKEPAPARLEISTPLQLNTPALANLERYDALRDEQEARHE